MNEGASSPWTKVLALVFALFLGWNAGVGARIVWRHSPGAEDLRAALSWNEEQRVEHWLERSEKLYGFRSGYPVEILDVVRTHVPADGILNAMGSFQEPAAGVFPMIQALCYPRLVVPLADVPAGWPRTDADYDARIHVLEFGEQRGRDLTPTFHKVVEGEDYVLWRCREDPP